jgi:hypothetical protein
VRSLPRPDLNHFDRLLWGQFGAVLAHSFLEIIATVSLVCISEELEYLSVIVAWSVVEKLFNR